MSKAKEIIKLINEQEDYMSMDNPGPAIKKEYNVGEDGIIHNPGKFEGEMYYVPYFYDVGMNGFADEDNGSDWLFELGEEDFKKFPELKGHKNIIITSSDQGFIGAKLDGELAEEPEGEE
jgi:hypothetical protein